MRHTFLIMVVAAIGGGFALASCGGGGKSNGDMGGDMAVTGTADMVMTKLNCEGVGTSIYNCYVVGGGDPSACVAAAMKAAKPGSYNKWSAAISCGESYCEGENDMIAPKCVNTFPGNDMTASLGLLCDPGVPYSTCDSQTYMSTSCNPCLDNSYDIWFLDDTDPTAPGPPTFNCLDPSSADCTAAQAACTTAFNACRNDM